MSREDNIRIVRRGFGAALQAPKPDFATVNALFHPDHEFLSLLDPIEGQRWRGGRGFHEWLLNLNEAFDDVELGLEDVSALDDHRVLAVTRTTARGKRGGVPLEQRGWCVVTVRDEKVARTEVYQSREEALAAAGVRE
jgi:ketosteroid isomerase-like protein